MKIAKYWSKQSLDFNDPPNPPSQLVFWGMSDSSEQDAAHNAQNQLQRWAQQLREGISISRNYQLDMQEIREELIEDILLADGTRIGAITRNAYGALVLNTEYLLIADIDTPVPSLWRRMLTWFGISYPTKARVIATLEQLQGQQPEITLRIYETFAGLRVFVIHQSFKHDSEQGRQWLSRLGADKRYQQLCELQQCYRARLTPKPWRCGMTRPPSNRYPRENALTQQRFSNWVKRYEANSRQFSAVHLIKQLGRPAQDMIIRQLIEVHDRVAVNGTKPLA